eukprot:7586208-Pyramimonas_sp.AAC.1
MREDDGNRRFGGPLEIRSTLHQQALLSCEHILPLRILRTQFAYSLACVTPHVAVANAVRRYATANEVSCGRSLRSETAGRSFRRWEVAALGTRRGLLACPVAQSDRGVVVLQHP